MLVDNDRCFHYTPDDFKRLAKLIRAKAGITLDDSKYELVYSRLVKRLRAHKIKSFAEYCKFLENNENEMIDFVNALTTNLTFFFRERCHLDYMRSNCVPELLANRNPAKLNVWSSASSTGEEPYSIAMVLDEMKADYPQLDFQILATDLDDNVLAKGRRAVYPVESTKNLEPHYVKKYFKKGTGTNSGFIKVIPELTEKVTFEKLNLLHSHELKQTFDIIFCRNVIIYFDDEVRQNLFKVFHSKLKDDGFLILGLSEVMQNNSNFFRVHKTIYKKAE